MFLEIHFAEQKVQNAFNFGKISDDIAKYIIKGGHKEHETPSENIGGCAVYTTSAANSLRLFGGEKRIIRIGHNQATDHPIHIALLAFEEFIEIRHVDFGEEQ